MHGGIPNIYGVTFHQAFQSGQYQNSGWVFMLWDFNDPEKPMIHVCTYQPDVVAENDGIYSLDDFFIR